MELFLRYKQIYDSKLHPTSPVEIRKKNPIDALTIG